jgi:hypothetical protein
MRRLLLPLTVALSLLGLSASTALAAAPEGAQKAPIFGPNASFSGITCETGAAPTPKTFGFVVLNTPGNEMTLSGEVALKRAASKTTYIVFDEQGVGGTCFTFFAGEITTNKKGNGNLHFTNERVPGSTKFFVTIFNLSNVEENYGSPAVELD